MESRYPGRGEGRRTSSLRVFGLQDRIYGIGTGWTVGAKREPGMIDRPPLNAMVVGDDRGVCASISQLVVEPALNLSNSV